MVRAEHTDCPLISYANLAHGQTQVFYLRHLWFWFINCFLYYNKFPALFAYTITVFLQHFQHIANIFNEVSIRELLPPEKGWEM